MSNRATQNCNFKNQSRSYSHDLEYLVAPKYLEPIDAIISQRLISALRPPSAFIVSKGFVVSSNDDAISAIERFASFEKKLPNEQRLRPWLVDLRKPLTHPITIEFPDELRYSRPLLHDYQTCTISPSDNSQLTVQFGDGILSQKIHDHMGLPSLMVAEQLHFFMEPIPNTRGAKAFSLDCATLLLSNLLGSHPQIAIKSVRPNLDVTYNNEEFVASFDLLCYRRGAECHHEDLIIFPCPGTEIPWHFRERVVVTVSPAHISQYKTAEQVTSLSDRLSCTTSIIISGLQELFGLHSRTRVRSVALDTSVSRERSDAGAVESEPESNSQ